VSGLAALADVATELSPLITTVASAVGDGLTSLAGVITEGVDGAIQQLQANASGLVDADGDGVPDNDKDGDGKPDEDKGLDLAGKQVKLEMGPDGRLKMVVTEPDGTTTDYMVELNEQGLPVVVGEEGKTEGETPEGEGETSDQNQGQSGGGSMPRGVPGGKREEDGEHKPQDYPQPETEGGVDTGFVPEPVPVPDPVPPAQPVPPQPVPPQPFDTGAELSEAGPL
jgi:hypothetical protein